MSKNSRATRPPRFVEENPPISTLFSGRTAPVLLIIVMATHYLCKRAGSKQEFHDRTFNQKCLRQDLFAFERRAIHRVQFRRRSTLPTLKALHSALSCGTPRCQHVVPSSNAMSCGERAGERERRERGIPRGPKEQSLLTPQRKDERKTRERERGRASVVIPTPVRLSVPPSLRPSHLLSLPVPPERNRPDATLR